MTVIHPRLCLNVVSTGKWDLAQTIAFCQSQGITKIVVPAARLGEPADAGIAAIQDSGLHCESVAGGIDPLLDSPEQALTTLRPLIETAVALNAPSCYALSGPAPPRMTTDEAFAKLVETLAPVNDFARQQGVRLGIEHNNVSTRGNGFIHSLADAVELSKAAGVGICVELQNCWHERHLAQIFRDNAERFILVQCNDFVVGESILYNRAVPGDGDMPLEWLIKSLLDAGYEGMFDLELLGPRIEQEGYESAILRGVQWLQERFERWGV